jgi:prolyl oligopeptidase
MRIHTTRAALLVTALLLAIMQSQTETHAGVPATARKAAPDAAQTPCTAPPKARAAEVMDDYFGTRLADPYRWMESGGDELADWITRQGAYTECLLATLPGREQLAARVRNLSLGTSRITVGAMAGQYRFYSKIAAGDQLPKFDVSTPGSTLISNVNFRVP